MIPFQSIALCLSGGGYRAAAFSLGTLSYLHHLKLLANIDFISSTSGGTITNTFYSFYSLQNKSFEKIYDVLIKKLSGEDLLKQALYLLDKEEEWKAGKSRTLINAFAKVYDYHLFEEEALFGTFWNQPGKNLEVCFNCTDFSKGLTFRFQTDGKPESLEMVGNNVIYFKKDEEETLKRIKLSDILAASSCFPIGFEPILLPQDFKHEGLAESELRKAISVVEYDTTVRALQDGECIGLMDGGITDNQALRSAMLADDRRKKKEKPFDLFLITDVTSYFMTPYSLPEMKVSRLGDQNLRKIFSKINIWLGIIPRLTLWLSAISVLLLSFFFLTSLTWLQNLTAFLSGAFLITTMMSWLISIKLKRERKLFSDLDDSENNWLTVWLQKQIPALRAFDSSILKILVHFITYVSFKEFWHLVQTRISSITNMSSEINLKHARRLIFKSFFDNPRWEGKRCPNFIYELSSYNRRSREKRIQSNNKWNTEEKELLLLPHDHSIEQVAETARMMGTTLWFTSDDIRKEKLKKIIITGQFSTCANLLEYVINLQKDSQLKEEQSIVKKIRHDLETDWRIFLRKPEFLYDLLQTENQNMNQR